MLLVDANVLLYCVNSDAPKHRVAKRWIEQALSGDEPVGFAWVVLLAFVRVATLPAWAPAPLSVPEALDLVEAWLGAAPATVVAPGTRHLDLLRGFLVEAGTGGNLTSDAHLAALAAEYGAAVCTFDRDFARFTGIRTVMPSG